MSLLFFKEREMVTVEKIVKAEPKLGEFFSVLSDKEKVLSEELSEKVDLLGVLLISAGQRGVTTGMFEDIIPIALSIVEEVKSEVHLNGV